MDEKFKVTLLVSKWQTYLVKNVKNEEEAIFEAKKGNVVPIIEPCDSIIWSAEVVK